MVISADERILVVNDDATVARLKKQVFGRMSYQVTFCRDGIEALEIFKANPYSFDLVVTDLFYISSLLLSWYSSSTVRTRDCWSHVN